MESIVTITAEAIDQHTYQIPVSEATGASVEFSGSVRRTEAGKDISGLEYEAYESMATRVMHELLNALSKQYACHSAEVVHRIGAIQVGECAIRIRVCAEHRAEAFALCTAFMDRLKQDVPIWKTGSI